MFWSGRPDLNRGPPAPKAAPDAWSPPNFPIAKQQRNCSDQFPLSRRHKFVRATASRRQFGKPNRGCCLSKLEVRRSRNRCAFKPNARQWCGDRDWDGPVLPLVRRPLNTKPLHLVNQCSALQPEPAGCSSRTSEHPIGTLAGCQNFSSYLSAVRNIWCSAEAAMFPPNEMTTREPARFTNPEENWGFVYRCKAQKMKGLRRSLAQKRWLVHNPLIKFGDYAISTY